MNESITLVLFCIIKFTYLYKSSRVWTFDDLLICTVHKLCPLAVTKGWKVLQQADTSSNPSIGLSSVTFNLHENGGISLSRPRPLARSSLGEPRQSFPAQVDEPIRICARAKARDFWGDAGNFSGRRKLSRGNRGKFRDLLPRPRPWPCRHANFPSPCRQRRVAPDGNRPFTFLQALPSWIKFFSASCLETPFFTTKVVRNFFFRIRNGQKKIRCHFRYSKWGTITAFFRFLK